MVTDDPAVALEGPPIEGFIDAGPERLRHDRLRCLLTGNAELATRRQA